MRTIICNGDGGVYSDTPVIDLYTLAQTGKKNPRVCFLPTASADSGGFIGHFMQTFERYPCDPVYLRLFAPDEPDIEDFLLTSDVIYVGGGQTKSMLGIWREWGVDKILEKAYHNGIILAGGSAGMVCWFDKCLTDSFPGELRVMECLGLLPFAGCPHYVSRDRKKSYRKAILDGSIQSGYGVDDFAAIHFEDEKVKLSISAIESSKAYYLYRDEDRVVETPLNTVYLRSNEAAEEHIFSKEPFKQLMEEK